MVIIEMFGFRNQWDFTQDGQIQIGMQMNFTQIPNCPKDKHGENRDGRKQSDHYKPKNRTNKSEHPF